MRGRGCCIASKESCAGENSQSFGTQLVNVNARMVSKVQSRRDFRASHTHLRGSERLTTLNCTLPGQRARQSFRNRFRPTCFLGWTNWFCRHISSTKVQIFLHQKAPRWEVEKTSFRQENDIHLLNHETVIIVNESSKKAMYDTDLLCDPTGIKTWFTLECNT